jgi:glycosyltransferase involved in cell wall biosynthesis
MPIVKTALTLNDLPPPSPDKSGWPWTEQSQPLSAQMPDGSDWPCISIITPSYNQGQFIEETIRSVLLQGYPDLEYIIIDGGSTDNTLEILHKYEKFLAYWVSEPDAGQADAINKGFYKATGDLIGWQNSDDYYYPQAFRYAALGACRFKKYDVFYGSRNYLNLEEYGIATRDEHMSPFNLEKMIPNANMSNQSMLFRKRIFQENNFLDTSFHHCMDHEFFWRLIGKGYKFIFIPEMTACYRLHPDCKGRQLDNTWLVDTLRICKLVYKNSNLPSSVRRQAWLYLRGACLDNYGKSRLVSFRKSLYELVAFRGLASLDAELVLKYLISFVGESNLKTLRNIKKLNPKFDTSVNQLN